MSPQHNDTISDEAIYNTIYERARAENYPYLTPEDADKHINFLMLLVRRKIETLAGFDDNTRMTIAEALNHVMMSPRWLQRDKK